jgi:hypothetical protein
LRSAPWLPCRASGEALFSRALSTAEMARLAGLLRKLLLAVEP